ncbi:MAG: queuosine precursor transporter [Candidatus Saccharibacteria bacterium]|nr:queuosine precursor transporter [Candidatus Saccharibacteria bacterium]
MSSGQFFSNKKLSLLIFLTSISAGLVLLSNIAAGKLWDFFGIAVDGGIICFPLTYILGDLIVEHFGEKTSKSIVYFSALFNILSIFVLWGVIALPAYPGWDAQDAFATTLGFTPRIIFGSLTSFILSNIANIFIFDKLKNYSKNHPTKNKKFGKIFSKSYIARAIGSSVVAHLIDSLIFETIAFLGVLSFPEFLAQAAFAYVAGLAIEIALSPISSIISKQCGKYIAETK